MKKLILRLLSLVPAVYLIHTSVLSILAGQTPDMLVWLSGNLQKWGPRAKPLTDTASNVGTQVIDGAGQAVRDGGTGVRLGNLTPVLLVAAGIAVVLMIQNVSTKGKGPAKKRSR